MRSLGGWSGVRAQRQNVKGDQRILADPNFVLRILEEANERLEKTTIFESRGYTLDRLVDKVPSLCGVSRNDILSKGAKRGLYGQGSLFCYLAVSFLGTSVTDIARLVGMAPSAMSYAVTRGKKTAEEKDYQSPKELYELNN